MPLIRHRRDTHAGGFLPPVTRSCGGRRLRAEASPSSEVSSRAHRRRRGYFRGLRAPAEEGTARRAPTASPTTNQPPAENSLVCFLQIRIASRRGSRALPKKRAAENLSVAEICRSLKDRIPPTEEEATENLSVSVAEICRSLKDRIPPTKGEATENLSVTEIRSDFRGLRAERPVTSPSPRKF